MWNCYGFVGNCFIGNVCFISLAAEIDERTSDELALGNGKQTIRYKKNRMYNIIYAICIRK